MTRVDLVMRLLVTATLSYAVLLEYSDQLLGGTLGDAESWGAALTLLGAIAISLLFIVDYRRFAANERRRARLRRRLHRAEDEILRLHQSIQDHLNK